MSIPENARKKVIVICMLDSSHSARWLSQFRNQQVDFTLIPSTPNRKVHPSIRELILNSSNSATYSLSHVFRFLAIPIWALDVILGNRLRGFIVSLISKRHKSDYIHALELNHAGYIASKASRFGLATNTRIISTNWGSDIYWFQKYERHQKQIIELMKASHFHSAECHRDLALATKYGFEGKFLEVSPNAGGIPTEFLSKDLVPPSGRSVILVKGYETFAGRASIALDAISEISKELIEISKKITLAGDLWRNAAVQAAGIYKGRIGSQSDFDVMGDYLIQIAGIEKEAFKALSKIKWNS